MQDGSRARGALRTHERLESMAEEFSEASYAELANPLSSEKHLLNERRALIVVDPRYIASMPHHLILGITVWLLRLRIEAVCFHGGLAWADVYTTDLAQVVRYGAGVKPAPYFGGSFEGRQG